MDLFVDCPNCGKTLTYGPMNAGAVWLCAACGSRVQLPAPAPPPPPPPAPLPPPEEQATLIEPSNPLAAWVIALSVVVLVLFVGLLWVLFRVPPPTWQQTHRQDIFDLKTEAENLAARGRLDEAYARFGDLSRMVAGNPVTDPDLKAAIDTAANEQNALFIRMLRQTVAAAPPPEATQPVAAAPSGATTTPSPPAVAQAAPPARPRVHPLPPDEPATGANGRPLVDDQQIGRTITSGVDYLIGRFNQNRVRNTSGYSDDGVDALVVYALLQAYQATGDSRLDPKRPFMKFALDALKKLPLSDHQGTYGHSLRASALALAERPEDLDALQNDLRWLLQTGPHGAYTYPDQLLDRNGAQTNSIWDNSNSQYGLLGVWAAADVGLDVPRSYWQAARNHWLSTQLHDGTWGYTPGDTEGRRSMTLAGLASLLVTQDYLRETAQDSPNQITEANTSVAAINNAMNWLAAGDNSVVPFYEDQFPGYSLYGLERVGLASGFKFFGAHDWYRESAADVVAGARPDGGWDNEVQTSFALLFLARGRHPVMMNKLRFAGSWNDRPRDIANLVRYSTKTLERQLNWQVVPLDHNWSDWTDSSILYISGRDAPTLTVPEEEKIGRFVLNGGLLLTEAEAGGDAFAQWATTAGSALFAPYQWTDLQGDHPLWSVDLPLKNHPPLKVITNGARLLMIQLPPDISRFWQTRGEDPASGRAAADAEHPDEFALGLNIFLYAAGKSDLRNRLVSLAITEPPGDPAAKIQMSMLQVAPDSEPEPGAWPRFTRWFRRQTDLGVNLVYVNLDALTPGSTPIAHLTGVSGFKPTDAQCAALANYVKAGGVVLIDPCGGPNDFLNSVKNDLLPRAFPAGQLDLLDVSHPLLTNSGDGMSQLLPPDIRDFVRTRNPPIDRGLWILRAGKGAVILSPLDITSGLLGTHTWGIAGFSPDYSLALAKNFVLWAWDGARDR